MNGLKSANDDMFYTNLIAVVNNPIIFNRFSEEEQKDILSVIKVYITYNTKLFKSFNSEFFEEDKENKLDGSVLS